MNDDDHFATPPLEDLPDVDEQGVEVRREWISSAMQMADELVEIIAEPDQLVENQAVEIY